MIPMMIQLRIIKKAFPSGFSSILIRKFYKSDSFSYFTRFQCTNRLFRNESMARFDATKD